MDFTSTGIALLKNLEGFSARPYKDSAGKLTIGYGHLIVPGDGVAPGDIIEEVQATGLLQRDIASAVACVNSCVVTSINQNQFNALVIFAYNVGNGALEGSSLLKLVNANASSVEIQPHWMAWNKIHNEQGELVELPGLTNRRQAEFDLFTTPVDDSQGA